jgi:hypothetical protein
MICRANEERSVVDDTTAHKAWLKDHPPRPFLLVVPATLISQWAEEVHKFTRHINLIIYHGDSRQKSIALRGKAQLQRIERILTRKDKVFHTGKPDRLVVITSYETFQSRHGPQGRKDFMKREGIREHVAITGFGTDETTWPADLNGLFEAVLCDEAQYLRNHESAHNVSIGWLNAPFTILASATPIWSSIQDFLGYIKLIQSPKYADAFVKGSAELGVYPRRNPYDLDEGHRAHPMVATYTAYRDFVLSLPDCESALKGSRLKQAWAYVLLRRTYDSTHPANSDKRIRDWLPPLKKYVLTMSFDEKTQGIYQHHESVWLKNLMIPDRTKDGGLGNSFVINGRNFRALVLITLFPPFAAYRDVLEDSTMIKVDAVDGSQSKRSWQVGHRLLEKALFCINQSTPRKPAKKQKFQPTAASDKTKDEKVEKKTIPVANGFELVPDLPPQGDLAALLKVFYGWSPKLRTLARNLIAICLIKKQKAIVWTLYPYEQLFLEAFLNVQGIQARAYISTLDPSERQELQRDFNSPHMTSTTRPKVEVLVASYFTNGVGLNLHEDCSSCHLFDQPPSQAARIQAIGRTYRLGQRRPVEVVEYCLADSFDLYQLGRVTKRAMPTAMSFLDMNKLGVPNLPNQDDDDDSSQLSRQLSGWWKLDDGTLIHETDGRYNAMLYANKVTTPVGTPNDLLRYLIDLSRGTQLVAYGGSGDAVPNPFLSNSLSDLIDRLHTEINDGELGRSEEKVRKAQLQDLTDKKAEQELQGKDSAPTGSTPKRKRKRATTAAGPSKHTLATPKPSVEPTPIATSSTTKPPAHTTSPSDTTAMPPPPPLAQDSPTGDIPMMDEPLTTTGAPSKKKKSARKGKKKA